ncbi:uncharacterized protein LOC142169665 [Nicotiana tabacum]|uniref:Uncharacterized protein LOC142169665 n=1 Tax=Nicotiana tabacum TaxID=4097 RepID=A0AC58SRQ7_TOBAC
MYYRNHPNRGGLKEEFVESVKGFTAYAKILPEFRNEGMIRCPCAKCNCIKLLIPEDVKVHLYRKGFRENYYVWTVHGEDTHNLAYVDFQNLTGCGRSTFFENNYENSQIHEMLSNAFGIHPGVQSQQNVDESPNDEAKHFYELLEAASRPLYEGSTHSKLSITVRLLTIKSDWNISQAAMNAIIGLMGEEVTNVKAKKFPTKRMHYLPIIPRLKRLYASMSFAPHMRWHYENRRVPGILCHPSDGEAWKHFDRMYPDFANEPRNVRLGLCANGFTPFSISVAPYSCLPIFVTPYNLPPEMCMTSPYLFLTGIALGPTNPKSLIEVYLQPLIDELKLLWHEGVETYDISTKQIFKLRATLMWTINDFLAYGMLSGWSTARKLACPCCMEDTKAFTLKHGGKNTWFDCHRRFLPMDHEFRRNTSAFMKNQTDYDEPPATLPGEEICERVKNFPKVTESPFLKLLGYGIVHNWTKQGIFWELPY